MTKPRQGSRSAQCGAKGFTLIELMVVVAIIGVLSSIAIPNFQKAQRKALQAEAKLNLASIYAAQKAFYAEYSAYISAFDAIGYSPEGFKRYYGIGWYNVFTGSVTGYSGSSATYVYMRANVTAFATCCVGSQPEACLAPYLTTADPQTFTAIAAAQFAAGLTCDRWEINYLKNLRHIELGI